MKRRRTSSARPPQRRRPEGCPKDGKRGGPALHPKARPELLVVQVRSVGAHFVGKALQRDLATLDFDLRTPPGFTLEEGMFVEAEPLGGRAPVLNVLRAVPPGQAASWAAVCNFGLERAFPAEVQKEAAALRPFKMLKADTTREDLRSLAFVTIDGEDAKDFDDAVWAEPQANGGFKVVVAIADVAYYVQPGTALDTAAYLRGNSTYLPGLVLPMLPEELSNGHCSLKPKEDRPVLAVEMAISAEGKLGDFRFFRACIHSQARLTYTAVQAMLEGAKAPNAAVQANLNALHAATLALLQAKTDRGAMDLDLPEVKLELNEDGSVKAVGLRPRLLAHRLIEEMMIAANVCAATLLSRKGGGGVYRIHESPTKEKLQNLKLTLGPLGFTVPAPNAEPKGWAKLVAQLNGHPAAQTLMRAVLQSQQQAKYMPENVGHYGLALPLYTHFTSPIRRYADLIVHRAILAALAGKGAKPKEADAEALVHKALLKAAEHINTTERTSQMAEWEARDRLVAQHFAQYVGQVFNAVVTSVQPFGCFVAVEKLAEGLLPRHQLPDYAYVGGQNCWKKIRGGKGLLRMGSKVAVRLLEADPLAGRLTFRMESAEREQNPLKTRKG